MSVIFKEDELTTYSVTYTNRRGRPARVDGVPVWGSDPAGVVTVEAAADGMTAKVSGLAAGTATVSVTADVDLSTDGVESLVLTDGVTILELNATGGVLNSGPIESQA